MALRLRAAVLLGVENLGTDGKSRASDAGKKGALDALVWASYFPVDPSHKNLPKISPVEIFGFSHEAIVLS